MGLKQKNEAAFAAVIDAGLPDDSPLTGRTSQEDQETNRELPMYSIEDMGGPEQPLGTGVFRRKVLVRVRSTFDLTNEDKDLDNAETLIKNRHAANVTAVVEALCKNSANDRYDLRDMAVRLSAAQDNYHVFGVINRGAFSVEPEERTLQDAFLFEVSCIENDC